MALSPFLGPFPRIGNQSISDWGQGVNTSMEQDQVPPNAYIHGANTALISIGNGEAVVTKRKGCRTLNSTPVTGSTAVVGQHEYRRQTGAGFGSYHLVVSDNGRFDTVSTGGALTTISATGFTSSSTQANLPSFSDANNLCFMVNGVDAKKFNGTALQNFGIVKPPYTPATIPSGAPIISNLGDIGLHNGTYEAFVTFVNSDTGAESSLGTASNQVTVVNSAIRWQNIPTSTDTQVNQRNLYIRNVNTQPRPFLVGSILNNTATYSSLLVDDPSSYTTSIADSSLTILAPDAFENNPPPSGIKYACWHRSRMFLANSTNLYYSKLNKPEAFDPDAFEPINTDDGQEITGLFSTFDILIVLKSRSMWALVGEDPAVWEVRLIDSSIGCSAHRSITFAGGNLFWWSDQGPAMWTGSGSPVLIGPPFIANTLLPAVISYDATAVPKICAAVDTVNQRILFALPTYGQTRNTTILPWNYLLNRWESDGWDPLDVASMAVVHDASGRPFIMLGGYSGQMFKMWDATNDGVRSGTTSTGTFVAAATSQMTVTDGTASFDTTGGKLIERKVTILDSTGLPVSSTRPRITGNTGTVLTLNVAVAGLSIGATYTYHVGGPAFDWQSAWLTETGAFMKKRYLFTYLQMRPTSNVRIDNYFSYNLSSSVNRITSFTGDTTSTWDTSKWDTGIWAADSVGHISKRFRIGHTGTAVMTRLRQYAADVDVTLLKLGIMSESLSEKIG